MPRPAAPSSRWGHIALACVLGAFLALRALTMDALGTGRTPTLLLGASFVVGCLAAVVLAVFQLRRSRTSVPAWLAIGIALPALGIVARSAATRMPAVNDGPKWTVVTSRAGDFAVELPEGAVEQTMPLDGGPDAVRTVGGALSKEDVFVVMASAPPAMLEGETASQHVDRLQAEIVSKTEGGLQGQREVRLGPYVGRELRIESPRLHGRVRFFVTDGGYYQLTRATRELGPDESGDRFFASFRLLALDAGR